MATTIDPATLSSFVLGAKPGERIEYHRGSLDRDLAGRAADSPARLVRRLAFAAYESGGFVLVQRRNDFEDYSYLIARLPAARKEVRW
jgi:hypothetical protein